MAEAGVFAPDDRLELLDGQIYVMSPIGSNRATCVDRLDRRRKRRPDRGSSLAPRRGIHRHAALLTRRIRLGLRLVRA